MDRSRRDQCETVMVAAIFSSLLVALAFSSAEAKSRKPETSKAAPDLVWPLPPESPRIRYVETFTGTADYKKPSRWRRVLLGPETDSGIVLRKPYGVATDSAGRVYVSDTGLGAVVVFDRTARSVRTIGDSGRIRLVTPIGIALDDQERLFVADAGLSQVFRFDANGDAVLALGRDQGLKSPAGIAIDRNRHRLYVVDTQLHQILLYSTDGEFQGRWGQRGPAAGEFNFPTNVAVDTAGNVYVVDTGNFRVQALDPDGKPLSSFGRPGDALGSFHRPKGIGLDSQGHLYVVDAAFNNFQIFDAEGHLLLDVGTTGQEPGSFWLPAGIHIDGSDRVYVVDQINRRVQVFQYMKQ